MSPKFALPIKYCKYHLFGRCKHHYDCKHSHDLKAAKVISCRKMNLSNNEIDRTIAIIKANPQIQHLNFGRNRLSKKHIEEIAKLLLSPHRKILSLCLDSTCLGRNAFINIMNAASKSSELTYLDVADCNIMPIDLSPKNRRSNRKNRSKPKVDSPMNQHKRKVVIDSVLNLLSSQKCSIEHLIIGHNGLTFAECQLMVELAAKRCLTTLDLYGNDISSEQLSDVHDILYMHRRDVSIAQMKKKKDVPTVVSSIIIDYSIHENQTKYRCFKWIPKR